MRAFSNRIHELWLDQAKFAFLSPLRLQLFYLALISVYLPSGFQPIHWHRVKSPAKKDIDRDQELWCMGWAEGCCFPSIKQNDTSMAQIAKHMRWWFLLYYSHWGKLFIKMYVQWVVKMTDWHGGQPRWFFSYFCRYLMFLSWLIYSLRNEAQLFTPVYDSNMKFSILTDETEIIKKYTFSRLDYFLERIHSWSKSWKKWI